MNIIKVILEVSDELGLDTVNKKIAGLIGIITTFFFLYTAYMGSFAPLVQRGALLALTLPMIFLIFGTGIKGKAGMIIDLALAIISAIPFVYIMSIQETLILRGGLANNMDKIMAVIAIVVVIEATRRKIGLALPIIAGIFLLYAFLGPHIPGVLMHRGMNLDTFTTAIFLGEEGIFGTPVSVTANFIMVFVIFGAFLQASGAGKFFSDIAESGFGWMRGGPAKAATVGSCLMGMISGSAVANVMTVGPLTIPLMRDTGYKKEIAGAIEAVASTGGQIMPPVMGAAAFIMAEFLQVSYAQVIIAAFIPALLYYISLFFMVDLEAAKFKLVGLSRNLLPSFKAVMKKSWYLLIPVILLITMLGFMGFSPQKSAFTAVVSLLVVSMIGAHTRFNLKKTIVGLINGAIGGLEVAAVCACAGIVIGVLMRTGLGLSLTGILIDISGGSLAILMVLTMITSIILGMGLPTSACYIIVAVLIAPAMIQMGVAPMAAHLFAFYYGCLSAITPPVALAAYAAAGVAKSNPMATGVQASKIGIGAYLVPFAFVYGNSLLFMGEPLAILVSFITGCLGVYSLAIGVIGHQFTGVNTLFRILMFPTAVLLILPDPMLSGIGIAALIALSFINYMKNKKNINQVYEEKEAMGIA